MIARTLVPQDAQLPAAGDVAASTRRRPTTMDERTLVPAMLPIVTLNGHSSIPSNLPLESIAARVVVPRDINREAYAVVEDVSVPLQITDMDQRIAVPQDSAAPETSESLPAVDTELVDPGHFYHRRSTPDRFAAVAGKSASGCDYADFFGGAARFADRRDSAAGEIISEARADGGRNGYCAEATDVAAAAGSVRIVETVVAAGAAATGCACRSAGVAEGCAADSACAGTDTGAQTRSRKACARIAERASSAAARGGAAEAATERAGGEDGDLHNRD